MILRRVSIFVLLGALTALPALTQTVPPSLFSDLDWRLIGPFRAGRAVAAAGVPGDSTTFYFGAVDGGIWKTENAGTTWKPIFDGEPVASIGALAVSQEDPRVIYAGTGESDIRSNLASGNGVYKSRRTAAIRGRWPPPTHASLRVPGTLAVSPSTHRIPTSSTCQTSP